MTRRVGYDRGNAPAEAPKSNSALPGAASSDHDEGIIVLLHLELWPAAVLAGNLPHTLPGACWLLAVSASSDIVRLGKILYN